MELCLVKMQPFPQNKENFFDTMYGYYSESICLNSNVYSCFCLNFEYMSLFLSIFLWLSDIGTYLKSLYSIHSESSSIASADLTTWGSKVLPGGDPTFQVLFEGNPLANRCSWNFCMRLIPIIKFVHESNGRFGVQFGDKDGIGFDGNVILKNFKYGLQWYKGTISTHIIESCFEIWI